RCLAIDIKCTLSFSKTYNHFEFNPGEKKQEFKCNCITEINMDIPAIIQKSNQGLNKECSNETTALCVGVCVCVCVCVCIVVCVTRVCVWSVCVVVEEDGATQTRPRVKVGCVCVCVCV